MRSNDRIAEKPLVDIILEWARVGFLATPSSQTLVVLMLKTACTVAVDVGGSGIKLAYFTQNGVLNGARKVPIGELRSRGAIVQEIVEVIRSAIVEVPEHLQPCGVGIVVPGNVDEKAGIGRLSFILGWKDVPFVRLIEEATGLPVALGHDVSAGAIAEGFLGAGRGHTDWLFLALGTGLGSAFMLNGKPYRGSNGYGGELSHIVADPKGPACRCGKQGCLEMLASASGLVQRYLELHGGDTVTAEEVASRVRMGDEAAMQVWGDAVGALATVVAGYIESMNPTTVVIGGGLAEAGSILFDPLRERLTQLVKFADQPKLQRSALGVSAGLHGAALIGLETAGLEWPTQELVGPHQQNNIQDTF